ncbi:MAG: tetratricopeptide repeat protein [Candidatus Edwardsbacteria bacterium]|nr:tetratricopeptide repeat protein [Candidatus Edwardsbacteria bacterium]
MDRLKKIFLTGPAPYLWLALAILALYAKTLDFGFTSLDDVHLIQENRENIGSFSNALKAFKTDVYWDSPGTYYRPLLSLSFMLDHALGGENPFIYHLSNVLLHIAACWLLFICLNALNYRPGLSFIFAGLFAVHPALSQAVGWIPGRNDILLAIFILSAFIALIKYYARRNRRWLALHLAAWLAGLFTKEAAVFAPLLFLLYLVLKGRFKGSWKALAPGWAAIMIAWLLSRATALGMERAYSSRQYAGAAEVLAGLLSYIGKIFLPFNLSVLPLSGDINIFYGIAGLLLLTGIAWFRGINDKNIFLFGAAWLVLFLLPTFIPVSTTINFLEHRLYLPMLGVIIILTESNIIRNASAKWMATAGAAVFLAFSLLAFNHLAVFSDGNRFWTNAVKTSPRSALAHQMLGRMHFKSGRMEEARREYVRSLDIEKGVSAHNDLALLYLETGELRSAEMEFKEVLEIDPTFANVHNNLALAYFNRGLFSEARNELLKAIELEPQRADPLVNLGILYLQLGVPDSAEIFLRHALAIEGNNVSAHHHLGIVLTKSKKHDEALIHLAKALEISPHDPMINLHLAQLYLITGRKDQSRSQYQKALNLGCPRNRFLENNLKLQL